MLLVLGEYYINIFFVLVPTVKDAPVLHITESHEEFLAMVTYVHSLKHDKAKLM